MSDLRMEKLSNAFFILVGSAGYTVLSGLEIYNFLCCESLAYYLIVTEIVFIAIRFLLFVFVILFRVFTCYSTKYEWVYKIYLVMILIGLLQFGTLTFFYSLFYSRWFTLIIIGEFFFGGAAAICDLRNVKALEYEEGKKKKMYPVQEEKDDV